MSEHEHTSSPESIEAKKQDEDLFAIGNTILLMDEKGHTDYSWEVIGQSEDEGTIYAYQEASGETHSFSREELEAQRAEFDEKFTGNVGRVSVEAAKVAEISGESEAENPLDKIEALTAHLSEDDRVYLAGYANALIAKGEAQAAGNGLESVTQGQNAGEYSNMMSKEARDIQAQYLRLYRQRHGLS